MWILVSINYEYLNENIFANFLLNKTFSNAKSTEKENYTVLNKNKKLSIALLSYVNLTKFILIIVKLIESKKFIENSANILKIMFNINSLKKWLEKLEIVNLINFSSFYSYYDSLMIKMNYYEIL